MNVRLRMYQVLLFKFERHLCKGSTDGHKWTRLKKVGPGRFSNLWQIAWIKVVFAQNHLVCEVMIYPFIYHFVD